MRIAEIKLVNDMMISSKLRNWRDEKSGDEGLIYWCQGCQMSHSIRTKGPTAWGWNGNVDRPTFTPSVLATSGHYVPDFKPDDNCWCKYNAEQLANGEEPSSFGCQRCHTFITDGMVQFLGDCTHSLAGQTLPLPDLPPYLTDAPEVTIAPGDGADSDQIQVRRTAWLQALFQPR